ncbi:class I SAM-dependent rRNA methyltransferase [uncultured Vagococcus sp.]|uniref:class I SAM-dependent rRNA methyltransferase n=1 Tax=uncultured Vagococcus sp. TaxID=189676 RepID=UPI0028D32FE5|nr:class I SAM-dependent rRNA methyltransferase [uncultured Vagococcus sp.]
MKKVKVTKRAAQQLKKGYPLIVSQDLVNSADETVEGLVQFIGSQGEFLGSGYLGKQNKGCGWLLSQNEQEKINQTFFRRLFAEALVKRQIDSQLTTAYRLFNGEGDGLGGVTIDVYEDFALFSWYNTSIYQLKEAIIDAFLAETPFIIGAYEKNRFDLASLPDSQHIWGKEAPTPLLVKENGITFATYLDDGMMTGIFLDQKDVRGRLVDGLALGLNVLNTFSYTGAFSVAAAMGGSASTVSVDLAKRSLPKTKEMFEVNGLSLDNNKIVVMDVFEYFNYAKRKKLSFDMIILDPPSFARSKKRNFSVAQNYGDLVEEVAGLLVKKGILIASTNAANVSFDKYRKMVEEALGNQGRQFKRLATHRLPDDFVINPNYKEGNYLKVLIYEVI